ARCRHARSPGKDFLPGAPALVAVEGRAGGLDDTGDCESRPRGCALGPAGDPLGPASQPRCPVLHPSDVCGLAGAATLLDLYHERVMPLARVVDLDEAHRRTPIVVVWSVVSWSAWW